MIRAVLKMSLMEMESLPQCFLEAHPRMLQSKMGLLMDPLSKNTPLIGL